MRTVYATWKSLTYLRDNAFSPQTLDDCAVTGRTQPVSGLSYQIFHQWVVILFVPGTQPTTSVEEEMTALSPESTHNLAWPCSYNYIVNCGWCICSLQQASVLPFHIFHGPKSLWHWSHPQETAPSHSLPYLSKESAGCIELRSKYQQKSAHHAARRMPARSTWQRWKPFSPFKDCKCYTPVSFQYSLYIQSY